MWAGWMRRCASLTAMRRISWIDQRISLGAAAAFSVLVFFGVLLRSHDAG